MAVTAFDTLEFTDRLIEAGVPESQARAQAAATRDALQSSDLATKSDIQAIKADLRELEHRIKVDIANIKSDIIKWVVGLLIAQAALIAALVKLL